ncbi:hypothetical protein PHISCL_08546, partial [Aspergillus sclerotialis]
TLVYIIYLLYLHPLSPYPGPLLARLTNIHRFLVFLHGNHHQVEQALHAKHGPVVRIAPNWLSFSTLEDFEAIYGFNKAIEKDDFYLFGRDPSERARSIFSTKSETEHRVKKRKVLGPALGSTAKVGRYEGVVVRHVGVLVSRLRSARAMEDGKGKSVNIAPLLHRFTLDAMLDLVWGPALSSLPYTDRPTAGDLSSAFRTLGKMAWACSILPAFGWLVNTQVAGAFLRRPTYSKDGELMGIPGLMAAARGLILKYPEQVVESSQPGILKHWFEVPADDPNRMTPAEMGSEAFNLMIAGPGSTAAALTALVFQLGTKEGQVWQEKLRDQAIAGDGTISPELNAVVKETLRLHAPFPTAFPRVITPGAETVIPNTSSAALPVGTMVSANTFVLGRSGDIWGSDADQWVPERWLGNEVQRREMESKLVAFSKGARSCIGKELASLMIAKATMEIIKIGPFRSVGELRGKSFVEMQSEILTATNNAPDLRSKAQILLEGVTRLKGHPDDAFDKDDMDESITSYSVGVGDDSERSTHTNIRRFILQSQYDPSVSERCLKDSISQLEKEIRYLELRHEHASFYSDLVTEWLANLDGDASEETQSQDFQQVGRAEMHEQRAAWESYVFHDGSVDADTIRGYLDHLFGKTSLSQEALKELRENIKNFGSHFADKTAWFTVDELDWVSKSLLKADLLSKEKTTILKEFMRNKEVAQEVADVLNMRLASLDSWRWPEEGIAVEMRRQLNGKYRVYMDEDLLDALMVQFLGLKWAVAFRSVFAGFLNSRAWGSLHERIPRSERERYKCFREFQGHNSGSNLNDYRRDTYKDNYFMTQLPTSVNESAPYDEDSIADSSASSEGRPRNALDKKHSLLHMLIAESIIYRTLHGQFTAIRSDFKFFGPSLPHTTILTVLTYFGVPEYWLNFFNAFLQAPIKFTQDGSNAAVQIRQRGVPMSHALSDCFGEVVLFCMDYAVNQSTKGAFLYRLHDDFWFWGHEKTCVSAWRAMTEFTKVMGLEFNEEKTGTVQLGEIPGVSRRNQHSPSSATESGSSSDSDAMSMSDPSDAEDTQNALPAGEIRWGFLKLDSQEGRFIIDQSQVDSHITELQTQLSSCKSIFTWVQAWNSYFARFFSNNFAKPSTCFGRSHIDMAISTLSRIERSLFPDGVTAHLRDIISTRYPTIDVPEGFFYFPIELGGLELQNPYIPLLAMRENIKKTPSRLIQKAFLLDEAEYHSVKEGFDARPHVHVLRPPSLEEYMRYPESRSTHLLDAYKDLIRVPEEVNIDRTLTFHSSQLGLGLHSGERSATISGSWTSMSPYWRWVAELYYADMMRKYGRLAAVDREFMPLGVVKTLKEGKFRWQG